MAKIIKYPGPSAVKAEINKKLASFVGRKVYFSELVEWLLLCEKVTFFPKNADALIGRVDCFCENKDMRSREFFDFLLERNFFIFESNFIDKNELKESDNNSSEVPEEWRASLDLMVKKISYATMDLSNNTDSHMASCLDFCNEQDIEINAFIDLFFNEIKFIEKQYPSMRLSKSLSDRYESFFLIKKRIRDKRDCNVNKNLFVVSEFSYSYHRVITGAIKKINKKYKGGRDSIILNFITNDFFSENASEIMKHLFTCSSASLVKLAYLSIKDKSQLGVNINFTYEDYENFVLLPFFRMGLVFKGDDGGLVKRSLPQRMAFTCDLQADGEILGLYQCDFTDLQERIIKECEIMEYLYDHGIDSSFAWPCSGEYDGYFPGHVPKPLYRLVSELVFSLRSLFFSGQSVLDCLLDGLYNTGVDDFYDGCGLSLCLQDLPDLTLCLLSAADIDFWGHDELVKTYWLRKCALRAFDEGYYEFSENMLSLWIVRALLLIQAFPGSPIFCDDMQALAAKLRENFCFSRAVKILSNISNNICDLDVEKTPEAIEFFSFCARNFQGNTEEFESDFSFQNEVGLFCVGVDSYFKYKDIAPPKIDDGAVRSFVTADIAFKRISKNLGNDKSSASGIFLDYFKFFEIELVRRFESWLDRGDGVRLADLEAIQFKAAAPYTLGAVLHVLRCIKHLDERTQESLRAQVFCSGDHSLLKFLNDLQRRRNDAIHKDNMSHSDLVQVRTSFLADAFLYRFLSALR